MRTRNAKTVIGSGMVTLSLVGIGAFALTSVAGPRVAVAIPSSSALVSFASASEGTPSADGGGRRIEPLKADESNKIKTTDGSAKSDVKSEIKTDAKEGSDASSTASADVPTYSYDVAVVNTFAGKKDDFAFAVDTATVNKQDGKQLIASNGKPVMDGKVFSKIDYWGNGVYSVTAKDGGTSAQGLVRIDGEVLIPCEAAIIKVATTYPEDARFLEVVYVTDKTENKSEAYVYGHDDVFSRGPSQGDTLYKGYSKVFDLQVGEFVEGVKITVPETDAVMDMGVSFAVTQGDTTTLYDESGKVLWQKDDGIANVYSRGIVWVKDNKSQIIDASGKERFITNESLTLVRSIPGWAGDDYAMVHVKEGSETKYRVIDFDGNAVFDKAFARVDYRNGLFQVKESSSSENYELLYKDGTVVADKVGSDLGAVCPGYNSVSLPSSKRAIYQGVKKLTGGEGYVDFTEKLVSIKDNKCLVLNDGEYNLEADGLAAIGMGLVKGRQSNSKKYGVYDAFTGRRLIEDENELVESAGGLIFTFNDGTWTVYKPELKQK